MGAKAVIDPDEVAAALWLTSPDRKLYPTWADVPAAVKEVWRGSYDAVVAAFRRAGYGVVKHGEPGC
jgi:hypothetical protein